MKRRSFSRPRPQQCREDAADKRQRLESAARSLLATRTPDHLVRELAEREWLLGEADRLAQLEPNPANLSRFRFAQTQYEVAQYAVTLCGETLNLTGIDGAPAGDGGQPVPLER